MGERRHTWGAKVRIAAIETQSGCDQTEQRCWACGLVVVTVHPPHGLPWKAWRSSNSPHQFTMNATPPCLAAEATAGAMQ